MTTVIRIKDLQGKSEVLFRQLNATYGADVESLEYNPDVTEVIVYLNNPAIAASLGSDIDNFNPATAGPTDAEAKAAARIDAGNITNWATWDEVQALAYIDANVTDLASAIVVLRSYARLLVALRDAQWPNLGA